MTGVAALGELPERERQILAMYYEEEMTMAEIGAATGVEFLPDGQLLAAAEPTGKDSLARFLERDASPALQAVELVVVTAALEPQLVDALLDRAFARRPVSLVLVDTASFNGGEPVPLREPALLRLQAGGVPVVSVQRSDDLAAKLSGLEEVRAASG